MALWFPDFNKINKKEVLSGVITQTLCTDTNKPLLLIYVAMQQSKKLKIEDKSEQYITRNFNNQRRRIQVF